MVILAIMIVLADRYFMTVRWDGSKDVLVRFDAELEEWKPRVISYSNEPISHIEKMIQLYAKEESLSIGDYPLPLEPFSENHRTTLSSRGSGQRSILRTDYEYWIDGFLAEIETIDGRRFYSWATSEEFSDNLIVTFSLKNSQPVGRLNSVTHSARN